MIVFIGSIAALRPSPGTAAYGAAKGRSAEPGCRRSPVEWAPQVRVVAVSPGLVRTEQSHLHYGDEAGIAAVGATIPAGRMAEPADVGAGGAVGGVAIGRLHERHQPAAARRRRAAGLTRGANVPGQAHAREQPWLNTSG